MQIKYGLKGNDRKNMVSAIGNIVGIKPEYQGAPGFGYSIGDIAVDKEGTVTVDDGLAEKLLCGLSLRGFEPENGDTLTIEIPIEGFTEASLENLNRLIASKATLIKKAIGADNLPVERTETALKFPWFKSGSTGDEVDAYTRFISAICTAAKGAKRVTAKEKPVENDKYAFRVFLIRLGFIGDEYKTARKILLKNLSGNSAYAK